MLSLHVPVRCLDSVPYEGYSRRIFFYSKKMRSKLRAFVALTFVVYILKRSVYGLNVTEFAMSSLYVAVKYLNSVPNQGYSQSIFFR